MEVQDCDWMVVDWVGLVDGTQRVGWNFSFAPCYLLALPTAPTKEVMNTDGLGLVVESNIKQPSTRRH